MDLRATYGRDPDGNPIGLQEILDDTSPAASGEGRIGCAGYSRTAA